MRHEHETHTSMRREHRTHTLSMPVDPGPSQDLFPLNQMGRTRRSRSPRRSSFRKRARKIEPSKHLNYFLRYHFDFQWVCLRELVEASYPKGYSWSWWQDTAEETIHIAERYNRLGRLPWEPELPCEFRFEMRCASSWEEKDSVWVRASPPRGCTWTEDQLHEFWKAEPPDFEFQ